MIYLKLEIDLKLPLIKKELEDRAGNTPYVLQGELMSPVPLLGILAHGENVVQPYSAIMGK